MTTNGHIANKNGAGLAFHLKDSGLKVGRDMKNEHIIHGNGNGTISPPLKVNGLQTNGDHLEGTKLMKNGNTVVEDGAAENGDEKTYRRLDEYEVDFA